MDIDDLSNMMPEHGVWYLAKCHEGDDKGRFYAEWSYVTEKERRLEFSYGRTPEGAMSSLIEKLRGPCFI